MLLSRAVRPAPRVPPHRTPLRCSAAATEALPRRTLLASTLLLIALQAQAASPAPTLLHAVLSVEELEASARFFCEAYGMTRLRSRPGNVFVGFGSESGGKHFSLELTKRSDSGDASTAGQDAFGGLVLAVANPARAVAVAVGAGAKHASGERCAGDAFAGCAVVGPDGTKVSFVRASAGRTADPLARVVLFSADVAASQAFYQHALGARAVKRQSGVADSAAEDGKQERTLLAFGPDDTHLLELRTARGGLLQRPSALLEKLALGVPQLEDAASLVAGAAQSGGGGALVKAPFAVPGIGTKVALGRDPDGRTFALVDSADFEKELLL